MSRFYVSASNSRGKEMTAAGAESGQNAHIRGWNAGVEVLARPDGEIDNFTVYATHGSRGEHKGRKKIPIANVFKEGDKLYVDLIVPPGNCLELD